ncbi:hypothetical protein YC2023_079304 [Brassica napus]
MLWFALLLKSSRIIVAFGDHGGTTQWALMEFSGSSSSSSVSGQANFYCSVVSCFIKDVVPIWQCFLLGVAFFFCPCVA